jgi:hypothetical protein
VLASYVHPDTVAPLNDTLETLLLTPRTVMFASGLLSSKFPMEEAKSEDDDSVNVTQVVAFGMRDSPSSTV